MILKGKNPTLQWIKSVGKPVLPGVCLISFVGMADAFCGVLLALQSKNVIDSAVSGSFEALKNSAIILGLLIILQFLLSFSYMKISADLVAKNSLKLQRQIFSCVVNMKYDRVAGFHSGELLNRLFNDVNVR